MGVRERTHSKRKNSKPQRKMKIPIVLLVACVTSLKAASLMDFAFTDSSCQAVCCPTTTAEGTTPEGTTPEAPTESPTEKPTEAPIEAPTEKPTEAPTEAP